MIDTCKALIRLLTYFAESGAPFLMEVAARTDADKKGGHLAVMKDRIRTYDLGLSLWLRI